MTDSESESTPPKARFESLGMYMVFFVIVVMGILSILSFIPSRNPAPEGVTYLNAVAVDGWKIEQNYDCMGCHTIVGNGAYFAPDLTKIYANHGPAWISAFLVIPSSLPNQAALETYLPQGTTIDEYYAEYAEAKKMVTDLGGKPSMMPALVFTGEDRASLTAWLHYLSEINTNGWPPSEANSYSFDSTFDENTTRWPESYDAWIIYWVLGTLLMTAVMFTFLFWITRGE